STASALYNASGTGFGGLLATNKVNGAARAYINEQDLTGAVDVQAGGSIAVTADDKVGIFANVKMVSSSITTTDGGASVLKSSIDNSIPADFVTSGKSQVRDLKFGDTVRLSEDYFKATYDIARNPSATLKNGDTVNVDGTVYRYIGAGQSTSESLQTLTQD